MNTFKIISCVIFSYLFAFTNLGYSQCDVTITNTQCRPIGIYSEADSFLTFMSQAPRPSSPFGTIANWTDPRPLGENETRTYLIKEGNFVLTKKSVNCENKEIDTSNPYPNGCQTGVGGGASYINTGCRPLRMMGTSGNLFKLIAPGDTVRRSSVNFIYIFMVGSDTIDIKASVGDIFTIDSGDCDVSGNDCSITIFNTQCRRIGVYNEADSLLTTMLPGPFANAPQGSLTPEWTDPIPLAANETRKYILKEGNFILATKTVTCANNDITTSNPYASGCQDGLGVGVFTNTGCRELTMVQTNGRVETTIASGESFTTSNFTNIIYIFLAGNDTIAIKSDESGDIDSGECVGADYEFLGSAFIDNNTNCTKEAAENNLANFDIVIRSFPSGDRFETKTDSLGNYYLKANILFTDTLFEIGYETDLNLGALCGNNFVIKKSASEQRIEQDFAVDLVENCPQIAVDIGAVRLRRCFDNTYFVNYFNYSSEDVEEVSIEVTLDPFLVYKSSSILGTVKNSDTYEFQIGTLKSGESGQFSIEVEVSCEAVLGQTHCVSARIFPQYFCGDIDNNWSGAAIRVSGDCEVDSVRFRIENVSDLPMLEENNFVVTEDVLMLRQGTFQLAAQEALTLTYPANGATYRLAADQVAFNPIPSQPSVSVEGCGGINTTGLVNAFPQDDLTLYTSIDCQENIANNDPNDIGAVPSGWGQARYIGKNTDMEYKIRFQNTGTDTVLKVVIVDTLSTFLDANTIVPGTASHAYTYQQQTDTSLGVTVIQFTFDNILLPDSTTNTEGGNGFVKFKIAQQPDLVDGTILENKATIYFDANAPITTNTTFHTIGEPFGRIISSLNELRGSNREVVVQPNPFSESTQIIIAGKPIKQGIVRLFNSLGQMAQQQSFSGNQITVHSDNLQRGFYIYSIVADNQWVATGKIQVITLD